MDLLSMLKPRSGGISTGSGAYFTGSVPHDHSLKQQNENE